MRFYCSICEREVDELELIADVMPPEFSAPLDQAIYEVTECRIRFSHIECGEVVEDKGNIPSARKIIGCIPDMPIPGEQ